MITEDQDIQFGGKLTFQEYRKGNAPVGRKIIFCGVFLGLVSNFFLNLRSTSWLPSLFYALFFALCILIGCCILMYVEYFVIYKIDREIRQERRFLIRNEGVQVRTADSEAFYQWSNFRSIRNNKKLYILYRSVIKGIIIPKRFFQNEKQQKEFEKLILEKLHDQVRQNFL
ncbi:YcxB family protein [Sporolactobacillus shoreicorticis]|uniref:YcxB family protein n=1 Tax=Sporolactobacillus shoreicorticis TaxID=1923877 RepID=A0ABW5S241_9BACL|nr:YcxB family protein [Sporolactobacillus shoreicorticis]MCO7126524.1 YcxB family protein [Sporolactobacillus shoreicorticis]